MIPLPLGSRVWIATGHTDMRRGMQGLALQVQEQLKRDPHAGDLYLFRGRRGDLIKCLWHDGQGLCLLSKRLERGRFLWPSVADGVITISTAQLGYLLSGIDWRMPQKTWRPTAAGCRIDLDARTPVIHCVCAERRRSASLRSRRRACDDCRQAGAPVIIAGGKLRSSSVPAASEPEFGVIVVDVKAARVRIGSNASSALVAATLKALRP